MIEKDIIKDNKNIFELFSDVDFYDYTKLINRKIPKNYQLTYSHHNSDFKEKKISISSPIAKALIGKSVGDEVEVNTPGGGKSYEIIKVSLWKLSVL